MERFLTNDAFLEETRVMKRVFWILASALLLALPMVAADDVIRRGVDLWDTVDDGSTHLTFDREPIPAGFFCAGSERFTGRVGLRGVPIASGVRGELGGTDTIVERLDEASFSKAGIAYTRIQVRALQLESITPIKTACGSFKLQVSLDGVQPITRMRIVRDDRFGGHFQAPISLRTKLTFVPVSASLERERVRPGLKGGNAARLELTHSVDFAGNPNVPWTYEPGSRGLEKRAATLVDTNFDGVADTLIPGTSNFAGGWRGARKTASSDCHLPEFEACGHCVGPVGIEDVQ